ncbi:hypothetical protein [Paenibacillus methanolicus]|nr:hypothetical protein [Paenibacillus methanolicus]
MTNAARRESGCTYPAIATKREQANSTSEGMEDDEEFIKDAGEE